MLWAALAFAAGIATGVHAWRPPLWWVVAWAVFTWSGVYWFRRRGQTALVVGLGAVFLLGALMVQVRGPEEAGNAGVLRFADGTELMVTAHVTKEGPPQEDGPGSIRQRIEVETEQIVRKGENFAVNSGLRINVYEQPAKRTGKSDLDVVATHTFRYGERCGFPPKSFRRATTATRAPSTTGVIWRRTESSRWPQPRRQTSRSSPGLPAAGLNSCARESIAASSTRSTSSGRRAKPR